MSKGFLYSIIGILVAVVGFFILSGKKDNEELQAQVRLIQAEAVKKPALPVEIVYRASVLGNGFVFNFKNIYTRNLTITLKCQRPSSGDQKTFSVELIPNHPKEIGHMEGWAFVDGDRVSISHPDFETENQVLNRK